MKKKVKLLLLTGSTGFMLKLLIINSFAQTISVSAGENHFINMAINKTVRINKTGSVKNIYSLSFRMRDKWVVKNVNIFK